MTAQPAWVAFHNGARRAEQTGHAPPDRCPRSYPRILQQRDSHTRFVAWVLAMHQLQPHIPGVVRTCSCGSPAVLCPYLRAAHDLLGHPMPWDHRRGTA